MKRLRSWFKKHNTFVLSIGFLVVFSMSVSYAVPPTTPYNAGETLDPTCAPGTANCTVAVSAGGTSQWDDVMGGINYAGGKVGIGTTTPAAALTVGGDGAIIATGTFGSGMAVPDLGAGTRMMWIPSKGAFRAGTANDIQWDDANVGQYSVAIGHNTTASSENSVAFGYGTTASGFINLGHGIVQSGSTAFGYNSTASGGISTAFGQDTTASGKNSTAFGANATASGNWSTAFGSNTAASSDWSTAFGYNTAASGVFSTAFGQDTIADSFNVTAIGRFNTGGGDPDFWVGTDPLFEIGNGVDTSNRANALTVLKNGYLGLSTATPRAALDIAGDGAIIATGTFGSGMAVPDLGAGTRMMWIPSKSAFRAGSAFGTEWDSGNVGDHSTAFGDSTIASGDTSTAFGVATSATGAYSSAFGSLTHASGFASTTFGSNTTASDFYATAFGSGTTASGQTSTAFGLGTTASGAFSSAFGTESTASGGYSMVFGRDNTASGDYSIAFGRDTQATGFGATAFGNNTVSSGFYSTSFGESTTATSSNVFVIGRYNVGGGTPVSWVDTDPLFEIGNGNDGGGTPVLANALTVLKNGNVGIGIAGPQYPLDVTGASGIGISYDNATGHALMRVNSGGAFQAGYYIYKGGSEVAQIAVLGGSSDLSFSMAGTEYARLTASGYFGIANTAPEYFLHVGSGSVPTGTTVARFQNEDGTCDVTPGTPGGVSCTSDERLKKNITTMQDSILDSVLALRPVTYNMKVEADGTILHGGFLAQELEQTFPDLVRTDAKGWKSVNYAGLVPYTVQAIKEMNLNIVDISNLDRPNNWRTSLIAWFGNANNGIVNFFSKQVTTPTLCVGTNDNKTCITKAQLDTLLQNNNGGGSTTVISTPLAPSTPDPADPDPVPDAPEEDIKADDVPPLAEEVQPEAPKQETEAPAEPVAPVADPAE